MKAEYRDDSTSGPGNGIFVITESNISAAPWSIALQRASDQKFLTGKKTGQWVGETFFMSLPPEKWNDGSLAFALGPEIVDSLDRQEQYRLTLKGADGQQERARLKLGAITYSPAGSVNNTGNPAAEKTAPPEPAKPAPAPAAAAEAAVDEKPLEMEPPEKGTEPRVKRKSLAAILILALLALGCLGWWYFDKRAKEPAISANQASEPAKPSGKSAPGAPKSAEAQVQEFFKNSSADPQGALSLAADLPKAAPADQDAVYRLYYFAAHRDEPAALLVYGACIDPSQPKWGSISKNAPEAWEIYKKAMKTEPDKARAAMDVLRAWLEKESAAGNSQAKTWLAEINR